MKVDPEAGEKIFVDEQLSDAVPLYVTTAPQFPAVELTVIFDGHDTIGFSLSTTVTLNEQVEVRPAASVAV